MKMEMREDNLAPPPAAGQTTKPAVALANLRRYRKQPGPGRFQPKVIDLQPRLAGGGQLPASPAVVRARPAPLRRVTGNLFHEERVLVGLDLRPLTARPC